MTYLSSLRALAVLFAAAVAPAYLHGQSTTPIGRVGVTVALLDQYPYGDAAGVIIRHAGGSMPDVIVLPASRATANDLVSAALTEDVLMERDGDRSSSEGLFRVASLTSISARESAAAAKLLSSIQASTPRRVPNLGIARAAAMYLPNAATRQHQEAAGHWSVKRQR